MDPPLLAGYARLSVTWLVTEFSYLLERGCNSRRLLAPVWPLLSSYQKAPPLVPDAWNPKPLLLLLAEIKTAAQSAAP